MGTRTSSPKKYTETTNEVVTKFDELRVNRYIHQVNTDTCIDTLNKYKKDIDYDNISSHRNQQCTNKETLSDQKIGMFGNDQIIFYTEEKGGPVYCFTYGEIDYLLEKGVNPHTRKKLSTEFLNNIKTKYKQDIRYRIPVYPLDKALNMYHEPGSCFRMPNIGDKNIAYIISIKSLTIEELPNMIIIIHHEVSHFYNLVDHIPYIVVQSYDASDLGVVFIYKIKTRNPIDFEKGSFVLKKDILRLVKVFTSDDIETVNPTDRTYMIEDTKVINDLTKFMSVSAQTLSNRTLGILKELSIKEFFPIKVYRGLSFNNLNFIKKFKVGDKFLLNSLNRVQSWTSTHCVSEFFAASYKYGIVVSTILDPDDIAIDTRFLNMNQLKTLFWREQREIMSVPFNDDGSEKSFMVTVETILYHSRSDPRQEKVTDILSTKYYADFPDKDISILDYKIGGPVSNSEAYENFFSKSIDLSTVPKEQKDLISKGKFTDPITLEETPLSALLQLKECGTILSRDTMTEIIDRNTSTWQGRQNVGFKSPVTGTIYGNLVVYNYTDDFLPQKNGILVINVVNNTGVKDTKSGKLVTKWYEMRYTDTSYSPYKFRADMRDVVMYYPVNKSGKNIVILMMECFKKGNLFAFDLSNVRHGRVHKKTNISGAEFGYPDDTYEMRVTGELMDMGCTPYTASFNFSNGGFSDPYPGEKRWIIVDKTNGKDYINEEKEDNYYELMDKGGIYGGEKGGPKRGLDFGRIEDDRGIDDDEKGIIKPTDAILTKRYKTYINKKLKDIAFMGKKEDIEKSYKLMFDYISRNKVIDYLDSSYIVKFKSILTELNLVGVKWAPKYHRIIFGTEI